MAYSNPFYRAVRCAGCVAGILLVLLLTACSSVAVVPPRTVAQPTSLPTVTVAPTATAPAAERATPRALTVALDPVLREGSGASLLPLLTQMQPVPIENDLYEVVLLGDPALAEVTLDLLPLAEANEPTLLARYYAPVVPFATVADGTTMAELGARWRGEASGLLVVPVEHVGEMAVLFGGEMGGSVVVAETGLLLAALEANPGSIGILPFDQLDPRYKVLQVDGFNVLSNQFAAQQESGAYPLAVAVTVQGDRAEALHAHLAPHIEQPTNRDASKLTTLIMTGVTAMSRVTALRMEQNGYTYPAMMISDTLRAANITHISNEVPFLDDCVVNAGVDNLILCSHTNYWAALEALGTDLVGLSGNHVNDFGREGARRSLMWYRENGIPIYGSGMNIDEACAPLLWEHNGNTFAFFAALAFEPAAAWATAEEPGACYYFENKERILEEIRELRDIVDIISVELQHTETYNPFPIDAQIADFRELREAGVDIVTGVQSHVPQAWEPYGPAAEHGLGMIVYGLGNLFFDQMWSWETRTELIARHAIYDGRLLSSEVLTAVLEDYAQPRWATPAERAEILERIFNAAPPR